MCRRLTASSRNSGRFFCLIGYALWRFVEWDAIITPLRNHSAFWLNEAKLQNTSTAVSGHRVQVWAASLRITAKCYNRWNAVFGEKYIIYSAQYCVTAHVSCSILLSINLITTLFKIKQRVYIYESQKTNEVTTIYFISRPVPSCTCWMSSPEPLQRPVQNREKWLIIASTPQEAWQTYLEHRVEWVAKNWSIRIEKGCSISSALIRQLKTLYLFLGLLLCVCHSIISFYTSFVLRWSKVESLGIQAVNGLIYKPVVVVEIRGALVEWEVAG
jgi:hypothetical protein